VFIASRNFRILRSLNWFVLSVIYDSLTLNSKEHTGVPGHQVASRAQTTELIRVYFRWERDESGSNYQRSWWPCAMRIRERYKCLYFARPMQSDITTRNPKSQSLRNFMVVFFFFSIIIGVFVGSWTQQEIYKADEKRLIINSTR